MLAILQEILTIGGEILNAVPSILDVVKNAIAAFEAKDQASLDAAHTAATDLANSLAPSGQQ